MTKYFFKFLVLLYYSLPVTLARYYVVKFTLKLNAKALLVTDPQEGGHRMLTPFPSNNTPFKIPQLNFWDLLKKSCH